MDDYLLPIVLFMLLRNNFNQRVIVSLNWVLYLQKSNHKLPPFADNNTHTFIGIPNSPPCWYPMAYREGERDRVALIASTQKYATKINNPHTRQRDGDLSSFFSSLYIYI